MPAERRNTVGLGHVPNTLSHNVIFMQYSDNDSGCEAIFLDTHLTSSVSLKTLVHFIF